LNVTNKLIERVHIYPPLSMIVRVHEFQIVYVSLVVLALKWTRWTSNFRHIYTYVVFDYRIHQLEETKSSRKHKTVSVKFSKKYTIYLENVIYIRVYPSFSSNNTARN